MVQKCIVKMYHLAIIVVSFYILGANAECRISLDELTPNSSLIFERGNPRFSPRVEGNELLFKDEQDVTFACPNASLSMDVDSPVVRELIRGKCALGGKFKLRNKHYEYGHVRCSEEPLITITTSKCKYGVRYDIGYVTEDEFVETITVCYDKNRHTVLETNHTIRKNLPSEEHQEKRLRRELSTDLFGEDLKETIREVYMCANQKYYLEMILGDEPVKKQMNCSPESIYHLVPHQIVPREDFLFPLQQKTSDYYLNTVPLWQLLAGGNWKRIEAVVRRYARDKQRELSVYTGALGAAVLKNGNEEMMQLHLGRNKEDNPVVPVPALIWKLVYDPVEDAGIVFVGVNNRDPALVAKGYLVQCHCICNRTSSWFEGWNRVDLSQGYIYCCEVGEFINETNKIHLPRPANMLL